MLQKEPKAQGKARYSYRAFSSSIHLKGAMSISYNREQEAAIARMAVHAREIETEPFLLLEGPAGSGKTTCLREMLSQVTGNVVMTAPTNKAVKVIEQAVPETHAVTIYALLGLHLMADGEFKQIGGMHTSQDLTGIDLVVIDEASMIGRKLAGYIDAVAEYNPNTRWILMGDRWQLPPVKETMSPIWEFENRIELQTVMRADNQILAMANHVRSLIAGTGTLSIKDDYDERGGVFVPKDFQKAILDDAEAFRTGEAKAIAWRNAAVDRMNAAIRRELLGSEAENKWCVGERVTLLEPAIGEDGTSTRAYTDEEGVIESIVEAKNPIWRSFKCWHFTVYMEDHRRVHLWTLHDSDRAKYDKHLAHLVEKAKVERKVWRDFWKFKEAFHSIRHAYATTAHRSQGSTHIRTYVNWRDILANPKRSEAMRCLYVAVSRPKQKLFMG